jgi:hypothetical protein
VLPIDTRWKCIKDNQSWWCDRQVDPLASCTFLQVHCLSFLCQVHTPEGVGHFVQPLLRSSSLTQHNSPALVEAATASTCIDWTIIAACSVLLEWCRWRCYVKPPGAHVWWCYCLATAAAADALACYVALRARHHCSC